MQYNSSGRGFLNNIPPIVRNLIIINALMLLATTLFKGFMTEHFALFFPESPLFRPVQLFTHMFMHGNIWHLFFNMYALWIFGSVLEQYWGPKRFLTYYLITGIGAAGFYMLVQWLQVLHIESNIDPAILTQLKDQLNSDALHLLRTNQILKASDMPQIEQWCQMMLSSVVGASGAIFGVLLAFGVLFPNVQLQLLFPPVILKAKWFVIIYGALELMLGFANAQGDNVAHFAHVGGMLFGIILIWYWKKKGTWRAH